MDTSGCCLMYLQGRPEHGRAVAEDVRGRHPGIRILLAARGIPGGKPAWADALVGAEGVRAALRENGVNRPDLFVHVISNEHAYLKPSDLIRGILLSFTLLPGKRETRLYAWSGRYTLREGLREAAMKAAGLAWRPFYLAGVRFLRAACEKVFPLINGKPRGNPLDLDRVGKVLLLSLDLAGDMVWAAPAISSVKRRLPAASVDLLVSGRNVPLARMVEGVDRVIEYEAPWLRKVHDPAGAREKKRGRFRNIAARLSILSSGYDLVVDFRGEARDTVLAYFTGAPYRVGFSGKPAGVIRPEDVSCLLTHEVSPQSGAHVLHRNLSVTGSLGFDPAPPERWLAAGQPEMEKVGRLLAEGGVREGDLIVGMQPGASRAEKRWGGDGFSIVASGLMDGGAKVVVAGSPGEAFLGSYIKARAPGVIDLTGRTTMPEFVALISRCSLFISNETSAISISSAVKTPVLCLMTGVPEMYGPYRVRCAVLQRKPDCYDPVGEHCFCPYGYRCLRKITPGEVLKAARDMLKDIRPAVWADV